MSRTSRISRTLRLVDAATLTTATSSRMLSTMPKHLDRKISVPASCALVDPVAVDAPCTRGTLRASPILATARFLDLVVQARSPAAGLRPSLTRRFGSNARDGGVPVTIALWQRPRMSASCLHFAVGKHRRMLHSCTTRPVWKQICDSGLLRIARIDVHCQLITSRKNGVKCQKKHPIAM